MRKRNVLVGMLVICASGCNSFEDNNGHNKVPEVRDDQCSYLSGFRDGVKVAVEYNGVGPSLDRFPETSREKNYDAGFTRGRKVVSEAILEKMKNTIEKFSHDEMDPGQRNGDGPRF